MIPTNYNLAYELRLDAERNSDPDKYMQAAAEFDAIGMPAAAQACIERARHYQDLQDIVIPQEAQ